VDSCCFFPAPIRVYPWLPPFLLLLFLSVVSPLLWLFPLPFTRSSLFSAASAVSAPAVLLCGFFCRLPGLGRSPCSPVFLLFLRVSRAVSSCCELSAERYAFPSPSQQSYRQSTPAPRFAPFLSFRRFSCCCLPKLCCPLRSLRLCVERFFCFLHKR